MEIPGFGTQVMAFLPGCRGRPLRLPAAILGVTAASLVWKSRQVSVRNLGKVKFDGPSLYGYKEDVRQPDFMDESGIGPITMLTEITRPDGTTEKREVGRLSQQLIDEAEEEMEAERAARKKHDTETHYSELETINVNGTIYNISQMAEALMKSKGISAEAVPDHILRHEDARPRKPMSNKPIHVPHNQWRYFKMKNYEKWENLAEREDKINERISDGRWLRMLKRERPEGFKNYAQVGNQILHIVQIAKDPTIHQNTSLMSELNRTEPRIFKKLSRMKRKNKTVNELVEPVPLHPSYLEWYDKLSLEEIHGIRDEENYDFLSQIRKTPRIRKPRGSLGGRQALKKLAKETSHMKATPRYPRPWRQKGFARVEYPARPLFDFKHKMALHRMKKEEAAASTADKQRLREFRDLEARRRLALRRQKHKARDRASLKQRITGLKALERVKKLSKKDKKREKLQEIPDHEPFFKLT